MTHPLSQKKLLKPKIQVLLGLRAKIHQNQFKQIKNFFSSNKELEKKNTIKEQAKRGLLPSRQRGVFLKDVSSVTQSYQAICCNLQRTRTIHLIKIKTNKIDLACCV